MRHHASKSGCLAVLVHRSVALANNTNLARRDPNKGVNTKNIPHRRDISIGRARITLHLVIHGKLCGHAEIKFHDVTNHTGIFIHGFR